MSLYFIYFSEAIGRYVFVLIINSLHFNYFHRNQDLILSLCISHKCILILDICTEKQNSAKHFLCNLIFNNLLLFYLGEKIYFHIGQEQRYSS